MLEQPTSRAAKTAKAVKTTRKKRTTPILPQITQEEADKARERIVLRTFKPSVTRPPAEFLPLPQLITILDQGREGTTVGMAIAAALNYLHAEQGDPVLFSPRMIYEVARAYDEWPGTEYEGTSLIGGIAGLMNHGVCPDRDWPYPMKEPGPKALETAARYIPSAALRVDRNLDHLRAAIFEHHAVVVSANIHEGWTKPRGGIVGQEKAGKTIGGQCLVLLGYTSKGFISQNSWGQQWSQLKIGGKNCPGLALWPYDDAARNMIDAWVLSLSPQIYRAPLVGYDADSLAGEDLLNIKAEVNAFSYVLASRAIAPPLALGLFGDWGSGKSFFMQEMQKKIQSLAGLSQRQLDQGKPAPVFCSNIVQIRFNAWHYLDTDLWASLVTEIFDKIFAFIGGGSGKPEEQLPQLAAELENANGVYQQAKQQLDDAIVARDSAAMALKKAAENRAQAEANLQSQLDDLASLLRDKSEIQAKLTELAKGMGLPELATSYQALCRQAEEVKGLGHRFAVLAQTLLASPQDNKRLFLLVCAILSPVAIVGLIELLQIMFPDQLAGFQSLSVQLSTFFASITAWLAAQAKRGEKLVRQLEETHRQLETLRQTRRTQLVADQEQDLQALHDREKAARQGVREAELRVQTLQREIQDLQPGRLILRFIEERSRSTDYRSRLGIVSLVRRDFERLSELADPDSANHDGNLMPVQRIILYIDDLDRCRQERVIEVLEAVHLLLAFRLFMVVVAVDPRWLRRCLEKHYPDLLIAETQDLAAVAQLVSSRPATAQDYLEKIFQIPFTLQPLNADGYRNLIRGLTEQNLPADHAGPPTGMIGEHPADTPEQAVGEPPPADAAEPEVEPIDKERIRQKAKEEFRAMTADEDQAESEASAVERLLLRPWELRDMERLSSLFHTPRSVKRFVNTYRFLRASVRPQYLARFEGVDSEPGVYRAAMTLLAIVISHSNIAPRFLKRILENRAEADADKVWLNFLTRVRSEVGSLTKGADAPPQEVKVAAAAADTTDANQAGSPKKPGNWEELEWVQLCDRLVELSDGAFPVASTDELEEWIYLVSRFSFSLASMATLTPR